MKNSDILHISAQNIVMVLVPTIYVFEQNKEKK